MAVNLNQCNVTIRLRHADRITGWDVICSEHGYLKTKRTKQLAMQSARIHLEIRAEIPEPGNM